MLPLQAEVKFEHFKKIRNFWLKFDNFLPNSFTFVKIQNRVLTVGHFCLNLQKSTKFAQICQIFAKKKITLLVWNSILHNQYGELLFPPRV